MGECTRQDNEVPGYLVGARCPSLTLGDAIPAAFERVRTLAGAAISPDPGQPALDEILAASLLAPAIG